MGYSDDFVKMVIASTAFIFVMAVLIVFTSIGSIFFGFEAIPLQICALIAGILAAYFAATEIMKKKFYQKHTL